MTGLRAELQRRARLHPEWPLVPTAALAWVLLALPRHPPFAHWCIMAAAMTLPAALPGARRMALTGLWRWRHRAVALFSGAHLAVWAAVGVVAVPAGELVRAAAGRFAPAVVAGLLLLAAAWELTPAKARTLRAGHRIEVVPPTGRAALVGLLREGARHGARCVHGCGLLMAGPAVAGHSGLLLMLPLTGVVVVQKLARRPSEYAGTTAVVVVGTALLATT